MIHQPCKQKDRKKTDPLTRPCKRSAQPEAEQEENRVIEEPKPGIK
ncbi:hypothetical protein M072_4210 [Bacteroides fragilis str. DS-208]|nr:hypothetical protein M072_4210 [Bacteroides fragilis str. DS-208]